MPKEIVLGTVLKPRGTGSKRRLVEKKDFLMYIPLLDSLQQLLENQSIDAQVWIIHFLKMVFIGNGIACVRLPS